MNNLIKKLSAHSIRKLATDKIEFHYASYIILCKDILDVLYNVFRQHINLIATLVKYYSKQDISIMLKLVHGQRFILIDCVNMYNKLYTELIDPTKEQKDRIIKHMNSYDPTTKNVSMSLHQLNASYLALNIECGKSNITDCEKVHIDLMIHSNSIYAIKNNLEELVELQNN